jgi:hypothetical protein
MADELPPLWALDKAAKASEVFSSWSEVPKHSWSSPSIIAHARTIAQYEQPPVDEDEASLERILNAWMGTESVNRECHSYPAALAQFKRELEGRKAAPESQRCKVPQGETPLDDKLGHRLLDVVNEGRVARDNGTGSPYHGHSLEHCLHAIGWVQRDLRIALDKALAELEARK